MNREYPQRQQPSFFFPIALITAGIVWLLVNNGTIPVENLYRLAAFWPVLLIIAGIGLLFRRLWWPVNALIWAAVAVLVLWLLTGGAGFLPQRAAAQFKHETLTTDVGSAKSAAVRLDLSIYATTIQALENNTDLVVADVYSNNGMLLDASGGERKNIQLRGNFQPGNFIFNPRIDEWVESASRRWEIELTKSIPLDLFVDVGTGSTKMDLAGIKLEKLRVEGGTGSMDIDLSKSQASTSQASLPVSIDVGTGSLDLILPNSAPVEVNYQGGTGSTRITLPQGAGVQVEVRDGGVGSLRLPDGFTKVRGEAGEDEGVWENAAFSGAKTPIKITLDMGTGSVTIH